MKWASALSLGEKARLLWALWALVSSVALHAKGDWAVVGADPAQAVFLVAEGEGGAQVVAFELRESRRVEGVDELVLMFEGLEGSTFGSLSPDWVELPEGPLALEAGGSASVEMTVTPPDTLKPGLYRGRVRSEGHGSLFEVLLYVQGEVALEAGYDHWFAVSEPVSIASLPVPAAYFDVSPGLRTLEVIAAAGSDSDRAAATSVRYPRRTGSGSLGWARVGQFHEIDAAGDVVADGYLAIRLKEGQFAAQWPTGLRYVGRTLINDRVASEPESALPPPGFALVPAGTFAMGSPESEPGRDSDEVQHEVTLTRAMYVATTEVTNARMAAVLNWALGEGLLNVTASSVGNAEGEEQELVDLDDEDCQITFDGSQFAAEAGKEDYPCMEVSWYGAMAFCHYLTRMEGGLAQAVDLSDWSIDFAATGYRLPTEAEWEYACRAGTTTAFYSGDLTHLGFEPVDPNLDAVGWYWGNSTNAENPISEGKGTHPIGLKEPNPHGLCDMHGNVMEWCWDYYGAYQGDATDPVGPETGTQRVLRGGGWTNWSELCRSAYRNLVAPEVTRFEVGFRVIRTAD